MFYMPIVMLVYAKYVDIIGLWLFDVAKAYHEIEQGKKNLGLQIKETIPN